MFLVSYQYILQKVLIIIKSLKFGVEHPINNHIQGTRCPEVVAEVPTRAFDFAHIVARKPPSLAIEHPLPPAALLLTSHTDDVTLSKGELILVGLLEVETCLYQQLLSAVF